MMTDRGDTLEGTNGDAARGSSPTCRTEQREHDKGETDSDKLYYKMCGLTLSYNTLIENSYPLDTPEDPLMVLETEYFRSEDSSWDTKLCVRCGRSFDVTKSGVQVVNKPCHYQKVKVGAGEICYYFCCSGVQGLGECQIRPYHVNPDCPARKIRFKKTGSVPSSCKNVFALDTEMCVTENGMEATKVSVVNSQGLVVYHTLVKPEKPIVDYVTQYSGVTEEDLVGVETTLEDVQAQLLSMFDSNTIVIGHGLQNDLKALRIIHTTVLDTSVLFPDPKGHPFKKSLKSLVSDYLNYEIQPEGNGHDSVEDARACMELVLHYIKSGAKQISGGLAKSYRCAIPSSPLPPPGFWKKIATNSKYYHHHRFHCKPPPNLVCCDSTECHKNPICSKSVEGPPAFYAPLCYVPYPMYSVQSIYFCFHCTYLYTLFPYGP